MDKFVIKGGRPLRGEIEVRGSKNAASKMMIASLLTDEECVIENVPLSAETDITRELCENIGSRVFFDSDHTCRVKTDSVKTSSVLHLSRRNRIPVLVIGPMLHRTGSAEIPVLGGCPIGHRPINFHVEALAKMGVKVERRPNSYYAEASKIYGADIELPYSSVGATENIILTAVLAEGDTKISNAAVEPEIMNLIKMLNDMGARIDCNPNARVIVIKGVSRLRGVTARVMPDRNEIVSLAIAAIATKGEIFIRDIAEDYLLSFIEKLKKIGAGCENTKNGFKFWGEKSYNPVFAETSPHPGFMTDWQQPFCVLLTQAQGKSIIHETVYEDRFGYTKDLNRMGARIEISSECPEGRFCRYQGKGFGHTAHISGPVRLSGKELEMTDIRAGMAHVIAALSAEGKSVISGIEHLDRGYEKMDERLRVLGADIKRI